MSSVLAALFITALKLIVGLETNSLGILSEAAHSGLDLIAAIITYIAVTISDRPPDLDHQYGHGKIENVSAFVETFLLIITCAWIIWEAVGRLTAQSVHVEASVWGFSVIVISIIVDFSRSRALHRVAKKHKSQALEADALHFSSDIWSSMVVIVGLVFVSAGLIWLDAIAALVVAVLVLFVSFRLVRRTVDALMDRVPEGLYEDILSLVKGVEGVEEVRNIRLRTSGSKVFVDATVTIRRTIPFHQAHMVMDNIEKAIHARHQDADVVVHAEPFVSGDETIADKVRMIVISKNLGAPHNLEVHHNSGKYLVDFDIEYRQGGSFVEAHDKATEIENEIRNQIPSVEKVTIHMEEFSPIHNEISGDAEAKTHLYEAISTCISADPRILSCSEINLLRVGNKYNLTLSCTFDKSKTLGDVHAIICELENTLYDKFKTLRRVMVHAEPS